MESNSQPAELEQITALLITRFSNDLVRAERSYDFPSIEIKKDHLIEILRFLGDAPLCLLTMLPIARILIP
jgi:hypothetical protein